MKNLIKIFYIISFIFVSLSAPAVLTAQDRVVDNAGILSAGEKQGLRNKIAELSSKYNFDLVIVTEKSIGGVNPANYAVNFYESKGYGSGPNRDGCIFLQVENTREIEVRATGKGESILNSYAKNKVLDTAANLLKTNNSYAAYYSFLNNMELFLSLDEKGGRRYNFFYQWNYLLVAIAWAIAFLIGFLVVHSWKLQMNTALKQTQANAYIIQGSLNFTQKTDRFLYSTVTKTARQTSSSGGGRSGGGRVMSSSGRSFSGGGRRY